MTRFFFENQNKNYKYKLCFLIFSTAIAALFSLPSILLQQFFPLDLGGIFDISKNLDKWLHWIVSPYGGSGRYFPVYWFFHVFEYKLFGLHTAFYFLVQGLIFFISALLTCALFFESKKDYLVGAVLFLLIYLGTPVAENINTIGKAEPLAYFFMSVVLYLFYKHERFNLEVKRSNLALIAVCYLLSLWTKETSIVLIGFCGVALLSALVLYQYTKEPVFKIIFQSYKSLTLLLVLSFVASKIPYIVFSSEDKGKSYISYDITYDLVSENFSYYLQQQPDILLFGIVASCLMLVLGKRKLMRQSEFAFSKSYILMFSLCVSAWAYFSVFLIWRWPMSYYLLYSSIIFKLVTIYAFCELTNDLSDYRSMMRVWGTFGLVVTVIFSAVYNVYITGSQIAYSRMYTEALNKYIGLSQGKSSLVIESYPFYAEQVGGTGHIIAAFTGKTYNVTGVADVLDPAVYSNKGILNLLNVSQEAIVNGVKNLPNQNDFLLVFTGSKLATWFLRGVTPYYSDDSILKKQGVYEMDLVSENKIKQPALFFHVWTSVISFGDTYLGYKLYRIKNDVPKYLWFGRYPDGWMGKRGRLKIDTSFSEPVNLKLSVPYFALPNRVIVKRNGDVVAELDFKDANPINLSIEKDGAEVTTIEFDVQRAISPKELHLNKDNRELGLMISLNGKY